MKLNIILIVPMETLDICEIYSRFDKYLAVQFDSLKLTACQFLFSAYWEPNFLQALMALEFWETME